MTRKTRSWRWSSPRGPSIAIAACTWMCSRISAPRPPRAASSTGTSGMPIRGRAWGDRLAHAARAGFAAVANAASAAIIDGCTSSNEKPAYALPTSARPARRRLVQASRPRGRQERLATAGAYGAGARTRPRHGRRANLAAGEPTAVTAPSDAAAGAMPDDSAARHLKRSMRMPDLDLPTTSGGSINFARLPGLAIVYCYPWTGRPGLANPPNWDDIPGAH